MKPQTYDELAAERDDSLVRWDLLREELTNKRKNTHPLVWDVFEYVLGVMATLEQQQNSTEARR